MYKDPKVEQQEAIQCYLDKIQGLKEEVHAYMYACMHMRICMYVCKCVRMCICMCICVYITGSYPMLFGRNSRTERRGTCVYVCMYVDVCVRAYVYI
jgi:hypothetical protein